MTEKEQLLRNFNKAFAVSDTDYILKNVTDDIDWNMLGDQHVKGKDQFKKALESMKSEKAFGLEIDQVITHGTHAAVNGLITSPEGEVYGFCDVYLFNGFKNPLIKKITSYVIKIK